MMLGGLTNHPNTTSVDTVIIGGGLAGLVIAYELKKAGQSIALLEKSNRVGGVVYTQQLDGYTLELGPNTVLLTSDVYELVNELNLQDQMLMAPASTPRYIQYRGRLHQVPMSPLSFLGTSLLSGAGKWRLLREPWIRAGSTSQDESLRNFSERRFGSEVTQRLLAPFVTGVWASNIDQLSASSTFPKLTTWEKEAGSVVRGMFKRSAPKTSPSKKHKRGLLGFQNGLSTLTAAIAEKISAYIFVNSSPTTVSRTDNTWTTHTTNGTWESKQIVLAGSASTSASLVQTLTPNAAQALSQISYVPIAVFHLGFVSSSLHRRHHGFGYLTSPDENPDILGCIWSSDIFPGRAPTGHELFTVIVGGGLRPEMTDLSDATLRNRVLSALQPVLGTTTPPTFEHITRYKQAIPQYTIGHAQRMQALDEAERNNRGLYFAGNIRDGISVGDVIRSSKTCAARLLSAGRHQTA